VRPQCNAAGFILYPLGKLLTAEFAEKGRGVRGERTGKHFSPPLRTYQVQVTSAKKIPSHRFPLHLIQSSMSSGLAVSVLDLVGMRAGEPAGSAIARSVDLAQDVEQWGYKRYWLAEHHSISGLACSATAVLIGHVAGATNTIRVGSGGVMLPNHAPLVVAEQFGTLEALYPGRIDLGLGRAPGGDSQTMRALRRDLKQTGDDFPLLLNELRAYLGPEKPGQAVKAFPGQNSNVPITLLGSSGVSAQLAGMLGLPFAFAAHFAPEYLYAAAQLYRDQFRPSKVLSKPCLMVAVQVIAAETDAAAQRLFTTPQQRFLRLIRNQPVELLPPVDSMEALWQDDLERAAVESRLGAAIVGSNATVKAGLEKLAADTGADEIIAVTDTYDHADRLQSYRRVADVAARIGVKPSVAVEV
jgi:luciferase family oxidoreductase group 1